MDDPQKTLITNQINYRKVKTGMLNWNYNANDYNENHSALLAEGKYRVRIINATETVAKNGTGGLEITFEVNGHSNKLRHYIWYNRENVARTNQLLGEFFNSFDISEDERDGCEAWLGKIGAVYVMHDEYKGRTIAKVAFCLRRDQQDVLPEWQEKPTKANNDYGMGEDIEVSKGGASVFAPRSYGGLSF